VAVLAQLVGFLVALAGVFLLVGSPWVLVAGGCLLLVVPEIVESYREGVRRRGDTAPEPVRTIRGPR
jgi:hypothetical protein